MKLWPAIFFLLLGLPCFGTEHIWISIDPQEITVDVGDFGSFYINLNSPINESLPVQLIGNNDGIAEYNESVTLLANDLHQEIFAKGLQAGHVDVWVNDNITCECPDTFDVSQAFVRIAVRKSAELDVFSNVVGWGYFLAWGVAFYPQIVTNFLRKSVMGLHLDFIAYNIIGFACYAIFNCGLYFSKTVQDQYYIDHPHGIIPVRLNDVLFSLYAVAGTMIVIIQAFIYERGRMSKIGIGLNAAIFLFLFISLILGITDVINWLMYLYFFSYVKLVLTIIKYMPQAYYNYQRKSTDGWNIYNVLLDFTGGILSILQMFLLSANYDDWGSIFGDPTKFGLGLFTVLFDVLFIIQHYILYPPSKQLSTVTNGDIALETTNSTANMGFNKNDNDN